MRKEFRKNVGGLTEKEVWTKKTKKDYIEQSEKLEFQKIVLHDVWEE